ncbi:hypothetical protein GXP67_19710 [Rhodocytophaga rosea]|uniref:Uncharacterized protein n=1 Tax=Rhodocytophaga rosea TaxID=2704465 RepID=A0A6C0GKV3_9BACT|nr:hypothetical protein [Rhodocytophaga rosea]QHT68711.1 hypothetical protein GXP67_19710 [Rhodocytophaga rosea]
MVTLEGLEIMTIKYYNDFELNKQIEFKEFEENNFEELDQEDIEDLFFESYPTPIIEQFVLGKYLCVLIDLFKGIPEGADLYAEYKRKKRVKKIKNALINC